MKNRQGHKNINQPFLYKDLFMQPCKGKGIFVFQQKDTGAIQIFTIQNVQKPSLKEGSVSMRNLQSLKRKRQEKSGS